MEGDGTVKGTLVEITDWPLYLLFKLTKKRGFICFIKLILLYIAAMCTYAAFRSISVAPVAAVNCSQPVINIDLSGVEGKLDTFGLQMLQIRGERDEILKEIKEQKKQITNLDTKQDSLKQELLDGFAKQPPEIRVAVADEHLIDRLKKLDEKLEALSKQQKRVESDDIFDLFTETKYKIINKKQADVTLKYRRPLIPVLQNKSKRFETITKARQTFKPGHCWRAH